jgi:hypothetical protein
MNANQKKELKDGQGVEDIDSPESASISVDLQLNFF